MRFALTAAFLLLVGCAHPEVRELQKWADTTIPKARSGEMKWSDYYKSLYSKLEALPQMPGKAQNMEWANLLISASTLHEAGKIDTEAFESIRRSIQVAQERESEQTSAAARRHFGQALQNAGASYGAAAQQLRQQQMLNRPIQCHTYQGMTTCY